MPPPNRSGLHTDDGSPIDQYVNKITIEITDDIRKRANENGLTAKQYLEMVVQRDLLQPAYEYTGSAKIETHQVNVRIPASTRAIIHQRSSDLDQTISKTASHAISDFLVRKRGVPADIQFYKAPHRGRASAADEESFERLRHSFAKITLRLSKRELDRLTEGADRLNRSRSDLIGSILTNMFEPELLDT